MNWVLYKLFGARVILFEIVGALLAVVITYAVGKASGGKKVTAKIETKNLADVATAATESSDVRSEVSRLPEGSAQDKLRKSWLRE